MAIVGRPFWVTSKISDVLLQLLNPHVVGSGLVVARGCVGIRVDAGLVPPSLAVRAWLQSVAAHLALGAWDAVDGLLAAHGPSHCSGFGGDGLMFGHHDWLAMEGTKVRVSVPRRGDESA